MRRRPEGSLATVVERLAHRTHETGSFVCIGLDPPGDTPVNEVAARNRVLIDATAPYAACFKPNLAFYEQFGFRACAPSRIRSRPSRAAFPPSPTRSEATWETPPLPTRARGIYLLCRTSNPGAATMQDAALADGTPPYERLAEEMPTWCTNIGLVVGATQDALEGRGDAVSASLSRFESRGVRGELGVVAIEDAELCRQLVLASVEPVHLAAPEASGVGDRENTVRPRAGHRGTRRHLPCEP